MHWAPSWVGGLEGAGRLRARSGCSQAKLHMESLWARNVNITTRIVDCHTAPMLMKQVHCGQSCSIRAVIKNSWNTELEMVDVKLSAHFLRQFVHLSDIFLRFLSHCCAAQDLLVMQQALIEPPVKS